MRIVVALASSIEAQMEQNFGPRGSTSLLICPAEVFENNEEGPNERSVGRTAEL